MAPFQLQVKKTRVEQCCRKYLFNKAAILEINVPDDDYEAQTAAVETHFLSEKPWRNGNPFGTQTQR